MTALISALLLVVAGCAGGLGDEVVTVTNTVPAASGDDGASATTSSTAAGPRVAATPRFGSTDLAPNDPITVTVFAGTITELDMVADDGVPVAGELSADDASWTSTDRLAYDTEYTVTGTATGVGGVTTPISGTFSTVDPERYNRAVFNIPSGTTVGVAAPLIVVFDEPVQDKAAAQAAFTVETDKGAIEGSWGWLQDEDIQGTGTRQSIVHFRPAQYWPAYTQVHFEADLAGVDLGDTWGLEDLSSDFTIGRAQVVTADVSTFRMVVTVDGVVTENYPVSYGKESVPGRNTVSGIHVVTEKHPEFEMCNQQYDYCGLKEKWAVRINNNGEFIHENPNSIPYLGKQNVSHGCINMGPGDAQRYYDSALYGDPVEVSGTGVEMSEKDYIYDWAYTYEEWRALSAL
ncbi:L,D-transpeptidase [Nakamurella leprariae]|uniref:L,D-transpeptidase family protein n=1 Tax=Nakamurella leprariae TaxID=2803911 RepID=A0A938YET8_9ACTN|nr:Ig-like domain-containing protein [Nakamurella leprariae]MBM9466535.1 L,D-transpeptidase family protein [Nakamurella leprariae]